MLILCLTECVTPPKLNPVIGVLIVPANSIAVHIRKGWTAKDMHRLISNQRIGNSPITVGIPVAEVIQRCSRTECCW